MGHVAHLLTAYVHHELPRHLSERVVRHVETCDACYAALTRARDMARFLGAQVPTFGAPRPEQLARLLPGILAEAGDRPAQRQGGRRSFLPGFGLALVLTLILALAVPALASSHVVVERAPDQPAPYMIRATATPGVTDAPWLGVASPTVVAQRVDMEAATEPAFHAPPSAPIVGTPVH